MARGGEEGATNKSGPEAVGPVEEFRRKAEVEIEYLEFAEGHVHVNHVLPAAGNLVEDHEQADDRAGDVEKHLYDVGPNDRSHAAFEGVEERQGDDQYNGSDLAGAQNDGDHDGHCEDPYAFGKGAQDKE